MLAAGDYVALHGLRGPAANVLLAAARLERTSGMDGASPRIGAWTGWPAVARQR